IRITSGAGTILTGLDFDDTDIVTDIELQNAETIDNNTDGTINLTATTLQLTGTTFTGNGATTYDAGGAAAIVVGSADVTALTVTTDSTGDAEVVLPAGSISGAEILDATILTGDIGTDTILAGNIAAGAVATSEILDGTIDADDLDQATEDGAPADGECLKFETSGGGDFLWGACAAGGASSLADSYDADVDGSDVTIDLTTADDSLIFQNPSSSGTDSGYVLHIEQLAAGAVDGLRLSESGSGFDITTGTSNQDLDITANGTGDIVFTLDSGTHLAISDGTNQQFLVKTLNTNFGAAAEAGAFINYHSYFGEEFSRDRGTVSAAGAQNWGDFQMLSSGETGACQWTIVDDAVGGVSQGAATTTGDSCLSYTGTTTSGTASLVFDATNLPVITMKVDPQASGADVPDTDHQFYAGIGTHASYSGPGLGAPTNFIGFSNCSSTDLATTCAQTIHAVTRNGSDVNTTVSSSCGTITEGTYAFLMIKVISTSSVEFWADVDASNGIYPTLCATHTANINTDGMTTFLKSDWVANNGEAQLRVDYYRAWQDDPTPVAGGNAAGGAPQAPAFDPVASADIAEAYLADDPESLTPGTVVTIDERGGTKVRKSASSYEQGLAGVISTSPHTVLGADGEGTVRVALSGRVPVAVSGEGGPILPGDALTSSSTPGVAMKATKAGPSIGKALEAFTGSDRGQVLVALAPSTYGGVLEGADRTADGRTLLTKLLDANAGLPEGLSAAAKDTRVFADRLIAQKDLVAPRVTAEQVFTETLTALPGEDLKVEMDEGRKVIFKGKNAATPAVVIDDKGNATFAGTITADKIRADQIVGLEVLTDRLARLDGRPWDAASLAAAAVLPSASPAVVGGPGDGVNITASPSPSASPSAPPGQSSAPPPPGDRVEFREISFEQGKGVDLQILGKLTVTGGLQVSGEATFDGEVFFAGRPTFSGDVGGHAVIRAGAKQVDVAFAREYAAIPIVQATLAFNEVRLPDGTIEDPTAREQRILQAGYSSLVSRRTSRGFSIVLNKPAEEDLAFSWVALAVKDPQTATGSSDGGAPPPPPTPQPTPTATPPPLPSEPTPTPSPSPGP
ncbi:MAG: hypothetical protein Q8R32_01625, partial [bacterium]|nr:hypothetical protein [bacterium]